MIPFRDRAADKMKRAMATWSALFGMLILIVGWIIARNVLNLPLDNPQLTILNLILSSLAGLQCFILLIAAKRGEALNEEIVRKIAKETDEIDKQVAEMNRKLDALLLINGSGKP
jgi:uncharacterized membrane protein